MMENRGCPYCEGGCSFCGYTGMTPFSEDEVRAARESGVEISFVDISGLPEAGKSEVRRAIAKIRARDLGIRIATVDGEEVPDPNKRKLS